MEINEVTEKRTVLEKEITELIETFRKETGCAVTSIDFIKSVEMGVSVPKIVKTNVNLVF